MLGAVHGVRMPESVLARTCLNRRLPHLFLRGKLKISVRSLALVRWRRLFLIIIFSRMFRYLLNSRLYHVLLVSQMVICVVYHLVSLCLRIFYEGIEIEQ